MCFGMLCLWIKKIGQDLEYDMKEETMKLHLFCFVLQASDVAALEEKVRQLIDEDLVVS